MPTQSMEDLIVKYLNNDLNREEWGKLQEWLDEDPSNKALFNQILSYSTNSHEEADSMQEIVWNELKERRDKEKHTISRYYHQPRAGHHWKVAAAILLAITFSLVVYLTVRETRTNSVAVTMTEKVAPMGQKISTKLPDGSFVWLNSNSNIQFLPNFSDTARDLYLTGEAYFEVSKDQNRPFRVHTPNMTITALGTIFNVSAFASDEKEKVTLVEGKIGVTSFDNFYEEILPGNAIEVNEVTHEIEKSPADPVETTAWKDGILILRNEEYHDMFRVLERWYGVNIKVVGTVPQNPQFFGRFEKESLQNVLKSMSYGDKFKFTIDQKQVEITFDNP